MQSRPLTMDVEEKLKNKKVDLFLKRLIDIIVSIIGIIFMAPLFAITAIAIKLDSQGPVFFRQERIGKDGKTFKICKFRTMIVNAENYGKKITIGHDDRVTSLGEFLRKYKIDEIPQLFNVLKGEMSIVGPRPSVAEYVDTYDEFQRQVLLVKPGMTGYASLAFKNESEILGESPNPEETFLKEIVPVKIDMDLKYIEELSPCVDIKVMFMTVVEILKIE